MAVSIISGSPWRVRDFVPPVGMVLGVRPALVVEVVEQPGDAPELFVLAKKTGVIPHRRLDGEGMLGSPCLFCVFAEKLPRLVRDWGVLRGSFVDHGAYV